MIDNFGARDGLRFLFPGHVYFELRGDADSTHGSARYGISGVNAQGKRRARGYIFGRPREREVKKIRGNCPEGKDAMNRGSRRSFEAITDAIPLDTFNDPASFVAWPRQDKLDGF